MVASSHTLHQLFEESALRVPSLIAVQWKDASLTYADLNRCASALAGYLSRCGVRNGVIVGLMLDRSLEMVVAIIGSLKTGAAYLTLLPTWPVQQRLEILQEAESRHLVLQSCFEQDFLSFDGDKHVFDDCKLLARREQSLAAEVAVEPTDLAYIIYTSGSTGKPKGVMMHHGGTAHNIAQNAHLSCKEGLRCCFSNKYTFDVHVADIFKPLAMGATVVVTRDIFRIPPVHVVSTLPNKIAAAKVPKALQKIVFTGEGVTEACIRPVPVTTQVLNIFGATEFFDATMKIIDRSTFPERMQSIGKPLGEYVQLWVMDPESKDLKPCSEPGELVVGGFQVARGYIKRPELTADKFFEAPWLQGTEVASRRVYRTGDLVRCCPDGEFEYLGRVVHRVEIHGHRIDLSSVEDELTSVNEVTCAKVVVRDGDPQQLVAYVSPKSAKEATEARIKTMLAHTKPDVVIGVDDWPRTSSGKIDKNRLHELNAEGTLPASSGTVKPKRLQRMFRDPDESTGVTANDSNEDSDAPSDPAMSLEACRKVAQRLVEETLPRRDELCRAAFMQALCRGVVALNRPAPSLAEVIPMTLLPTPVPRGELKKVRSLGPTFSRLVDDVSCDLPWLLSCLAPLRAGDSHDPFMARLMDIAEEVYGTGRGKKDPKAQTRILLMRQDYMPHSDGRILQMEINTTCAAFPGLTEQLAALHSDLFEEYSPEVAARHKPLACNAPGSDFAKALAAAHRAYIDDWHPKGSSPQTGPRVCFFCIPNDHSEVDQVHIEMALRALGVPTFRALLNAPMELKGGDLSNQSSGGALFINGMETSVVYFNCMFCPDHFITEADWQHRKVLELSRAVKAPSLLAHLAGAKKVQQVLTSRDELSRFLSPDEVDPCLSVLALQADPASPDATVEVQASQPALFMKPGGQACEVDACAELGIFSAHVMKGKEELQCTVGGVMLRSKACSSLEGGVCAGQGAVGTPLVVAPELHEESSSAAPVAHGTALEVQADACILLICGLPGCGKTSFCKALVQRAEEVSESAPLLGAAEWQHLCYDEVEAACRAAGSHSGFDPGAWRAAREEVAEKVRDCLAKRGGKRTVILLDDNMYYRSMRKQWYHVAVEQGCAFHQVFLTAPLKACLERNGSRPASSQVPDFSIQYQAEAFEWPRQEGTSWEASHLASLILDAEEASTAQQVEAFLERLRGEAFWSLPCVEEEHARSNSEKQSSSHYMDLALRKVVSKALAEAPRGLAKQAKSTLAKRWGARKAALVAEFQALTDPAKASAEKMAAASLSNEMEESFLRSCVADVRQVLASGC